MIVDLLDDLFLLIQTDFELGDKAPIRRGKGKGLQGFTMV